MTSFIAYKLFQGHVSKSFKFLLNWFMQHRLTLNQGPVKKGAIVAVVVLLIVLVYPVHYKIKGDCILEPLDLRERFFDDVAHRDVAPRLAALSDLEDLLLDRIHEAVDVGEVAVRGHRMHQEVRDLATLEQHFDKLVTATPSIDAV